MTQDEIEQIIEIAIIEFNDSGRTSATALRRNIVGKLKKSGVKFAQSKMYSEEEITFIKKVFLSYWLENNSSHEDNLEEKIFSDKILEKLINK